ncbi:hypothetical protein V6N13_040879 [Hibiscus sabdariffa]
MLRSKKLSKQLMEETKLSGKSLSDSDIKSKCSILIKEAREVLKLEFDNLSSECKLIQIRFIARAENKMAASLAIDGFSGLF